MIIYQKTDRPSGMVTVFWINEEGKQVDISRAEISHLEGRHKCGGDIGVIFDGLSGSWKVCRKCGADRSC